MPSILPRITDPCKDTTRTPDERLAEAWLFVDLSDRLPEEADLLGRRSHPPLDPVDRRLVELLVADGRLSVHELAARAGVARSTAYSRVDRLQADGVITGFSATVDPAAVGLGITALVLVDVDQQRWHSARDAMLELPGVEYLAFTLGTFDMVLLVRAADVDDLRTVVLERLHELDEVRSAQTVVVVEEHRRPVLPKSG